MSTDTSAARAAATFTGHGMVSPASGDTRPLALVYLRYLNLTAQRFLASGPELPEDVRPLHALVCNAVRAALLRNQRALLGCFASTSVGTPLQCLGLRADLPNFETRIDDAARAVGPQLLLEMALRKLLPESTSLLWTAPFGESENRRLVSPALGGELIPPPGTIALRFAPSHLTAIGEAGEIARLPLDGRALMELVPTLAAGEPQPGFRFEQRYHRTGKVTRLALIDHSPIAEFEAHPDKAGNHIELGGKPIEDWVRVLDESFALVEQHLPGNFSEMGMMFHEIIPVGYDDHKHLSASYREAIGTVYLTLHYNIMTMAEALVHEFQHNKINCAAYSGDFMENPFYPLYKSPVRPDPRPLWGILLAVHAFLPVAQLYRAMREAGHPWSTKHDWLKRMSDIDLKNHEGMEMLRAHAVWTPIGRATFDELEEIDRRHMAERQAMGMAIQPTDVHLA